MLLIRINFLREGKYNNFNNNKSKGKLLNNN